MEWQHRNGLLPKTCRLTLGVRGPQTNILDFVVWVATFLGVTFAGVEIGIAIGVGLSFLYVGLKVGAYMASMLHVCLLELLSFAAASKSGTAVLSGAVWKARVLDAGCAAPCDPELCHLHADRVPAHRDPGAPAGHQPVPQREAVPRGADGPRHPHRPRRRALLLRQRTRECHYPLVRFPGPLLHAQQLRPRASRFWPIRSMLKSALSQEADETRIDG